MDERTKKSLVSRGAVVGAALAGAGPLSPVVAMVVEHAHQALTRSSRKRVEELLRYALDGDDAEEFVERLNNAFIDEEPEVIAAFTQSARAAMHAIEPAVVPSIGLLFRLAMAPNVAPLPLWRLRTYLRTLEELTAEEFGDLRTFVHAVREVPRLLNEPDRTGVPVTAAELRDEPGWRMITSLYGATKGVPICTVRNAPRLLQILIVQRLGTHRDGDAVTVDFEMLRPFAEVMPLPVATETA